MTDIQRMVSKWFTLGKQNKRKFKNCDLKIKTLVRIRVRTNKDVSTLGKQLSFLKFITDKVGIFP